MLIVAIEVVVLLCVVVIILVKRNKSLKELLGKLQSKLRELMGRGKAEPKPVMESPEAAYKRLILEQISFTKEHHAGLQSDRDIVLDLAPESPLSRRAAALRYALFLAEKEATVNKPKNIPDWSVLNEKYERIFRFYEDYQSDATPPGGVDETEDLQTELNNANKRIKNLEKFKNLYFDLEKELESAKSSAQTHYMELTEMSSQVDDKERFEDILDQYHSAYDGLAKNIEEGTDTAVRIVKEKVIDSATAAELHNLRAVAANQHNIISDLQRQLEVASSESEKEEVVELLQDELKKQERFVQEAESCIQLMEDELSNANRELEQTRAKVASVAQLRAELRELKNGQEESELELKSLKAENRRLRTKMKIMNQAPPEQNEAAAQQLRKELQTLQASYNDLEEKYLELKMR